MNNKVYASLFWLTVGSILLCYVLKFFYPGMFLLAIENPRVLAIGSYIDGSPAAYFLASRATAFATYWLYTCACCGVKKLSARQNLSIVGFLAISGVIYMMDVQLGMQISIISMVAIPAMIGCDSKDLAFVCSVHGGAQALSLAIKSQVLNVGSYNFAVFTVLSADAYLWLILLYLVSINRKEGTTIWAHLCLPSTEGISCFLKKKFAKPKP